MVRTTKTVWTSPAVSAVCTPENHCTTAYWLVKLFWALNYNTLYLFTSSTWLTVLVPDATLNSEGIDATVAIRTRSDFAVLFKAFTDRQVLSANVRFHFSRIGRRWGRVIVEQNVQNVFAAFNRLGTNAVAAPFVNKIKRKLLQVQSKNIFLWIKNSFTQDQT